ncbi:hypothetical protein PIB30_089310 [Stylosanthes scabra]|uniref:Uncharacterized protein n=1 Tax=Stylosanthes scabra TaxID=79078 RepID=A0ABU6TUN7_9FABA|nr:hypothetical protein [Stylosanthes scabra]
MGMVVVITIHPPLSTAITFVPELRLTHRLRLREACSVLFDSIPLVSMQLRMVSKAYMLATPATIDGECASSACGQSLVEWMVYLDTQWREENRV